ncbi:hypothetical protein [Nocardia sp. NRRL S-836]|uniref:hypothetical protein n=1 Tax=Nocardia sp. NRRL S-836 TaxID=1519492 RepID=UPI0006AFB877|nr:hypothetical protein [Nocardia sp. NRRL S-836]
MRPFAEVLNELCNNPPHHQGRMTNVALAAAVKQRGGDIGHGYISQLRLGVKDNPTCQAIVDLAGALGVHPAVFLGGRGELYPGERPGWRATALSTLFEAVHPPDRGPWSPEEVAASISGSGHYGSISASYIRELLSQSSANPRLKHILGLADHFGADPAYFFDDDVAAKVDSELTDFLALRELGVVEFVTRLAERTGELSPQARAAAVEGFRQALEVGEGWTFPMKGRRTPPGHA